MESSGKARDGAEGLYRLGSRTYSYTDGREVRAQDYLQPDSELETQSQKSSGSGDANLLANSHLVEANKLLLKQTKAHLQRSLREKQGHIGFLKLQCEEIQKLQAQIDADLKALSKTGTFNPKRE